MIVTSYNYVKISIVLVLGFISFNSITVSAQKNLANQISTILSDTLLSRAQVGVSIRNVQTNALLFEKNSNQSFTPASNLKLLTTATALNALGLEYRFVTKVMYSDSIHDGAFLGTLLIKGSGDPTFGSDKMYGQPSYQSLIKKLVTAFKVKGISSFNGKLIIDPTHFEFNAIPMDYTWGDIGNYYGAGSFGLNINENQCAIKFKPSTHIGELATVQTIVPWDTTCTFVNHVFTGLANSGDQSVVFSSPYNTYAYAEGSIPIGNVFLVKGSISNPSEVLGQLLIAEMNVQGIIWKGTLSILQPEKTLSSPSNFKILVEISSPTLKEITTYTNLVSNNLYAECLLKELAFKKTGYGSTSNGTNQIKRYIKSIGVDTFGMVLRDGSGMSPFNSIAPNQYTQFLVSQFSNNVFINCIPIAGKEGTVAHICKDTNGKVRVKSGTMSGTTCYSGYVYANSGDIYAVSLFVNKHEAKNKQIQRILEKVLLKLVEN